MAYYFSPLKMVLAVNIDKSLQQGKSPINAASGDWTLNQQRAQIVDTVLAVHNGVVIDVFDVVGTSLTHNVPNTTNPNMSKTRIRFKLKPSNPQKEAKYKNKTIGNVRPLKYI